MPCGDYAALQDLHDGTIHHCPDAECCCGSGSSSRSPPRIASPGKSTSPKSSTAIKQTNYEASTEFDVSKPLLNHSSRYSCCRASPLVCPNQGLIEALDVIRRSRSLEGEERSALSYQRAIAVSLRERLEISFAC
jgi:DNA polymerase IV